MKKARRNHWFSVCLAAILTLATAGTLATTAQADPITYQIFNHPDGNEIDVDVDTDGYVLRLDVSGVNTFNANAPGTAVFFRWEPGTGMASIFGTVIHNESGEIWMIDAELSTVLLTDSDMVTPWYGSNDTDETYDDMFQDLLANMDGSGSSEDFSTDEARIYFTNISLTLTTSLVSPTYMGPTSWVQFPNDPSDKRFFIQYNWRTGESVLGGTGWLKVEGTNDDPPGCCQDFLFIVGTTPVPEPSAVFLLGLGLAVLGVVRRKRH